MNGVFRRFESLFPPARPQSSAATDGGEPTDERTLDAFEELADIHAAPTRKEAADLALGVLVAHLPCEAAAVALYDIDEDALRILAATGFGSDGFVGTVFELGYGLTGEVAKNAFGPKLFEAPFSASFDDSLDGRTGLATKNVLALPLIHEERLIGALQLVNRLGRPTFTVADAEFARFVGSRFAAAVAHGQGKRPVSLRPPT